MMLEAAMPSFSYKILIFVKKYTNDCNMHNIILIQIAFSFFFF
jgi:hypothetical protein